MRVLFIMKYFLTALLLISCSISYAQTSTVTFNELTESTALSLNGTRIYNNSGVTFEIFSGSNTNAFVSSTNNGFNGTRALDDINQSIGGVTGWKIKKTDGSPFQLISMWLLRGDINASASGTVKAYKSGSQVGTTVNVTFDGAKSFASNPDFYDIDEVTIEGTDIYIYIDNFAFAPALIPVDSDPALVTSISPIGVPLSTATSVNFLVTFSKTAKNVSSDDFVLTTAGTAGTIASVSGSGSSYTVAVNGISGEGTIRLDLKNGTNIANEDDIQGTPGFTSGQPHVVSACFVETFETETDAATNFSGNGVNFSLGAGLEIENRSGFGAGGSAGFVTNNNTTGSFSLTSATEFTMSNVDLFLSDQPNGEIPTASGTIVITGKKGGSDQFTISKNTGFPTSTASNGGFFTINFATDGAGNYQNTNVDELVFTISGGFVNLAIDNFIFCEAVPSLPNNAPVATAPSAPAVNEDEFNAGLPDDIQITDVDGDDQTVTFTVTGGTLTLGTSGITFSGAGNGSASFTASGTLAAINTALDAATFTPIANLYGANAGSISFVSNDGTANSNTALVTFDIAGVNDDPTFAGIINSITVVEDEYPAYLRDALSSGLFQDIDAGSNDVSLTIVTSQGVLGISNPAGYGVSQSGHNTPTLTLTGPAANIESFLTINTNIALILPDNLSGPNAVTITLTANDNGNTGAGGGNDVVVGTVNVNITPLNDGPVVSNPIPHQTAQEDVAFNFQFAANTFEDVDMGSTLTYTAALVGGGALPAWLSFDGATRTFSGTPTSADLGTVSINVTAGDGSGETAFDEFDIVVAAVNDAPVNSVPGPQVTGQDAPLVFSGGGGNQISISDVDAGASSVRVTLTATNGALTLSGTGGLVFTDGDGTSNPSMEMVGSIAAINNALNGLIFSPTSGYYGAAAVQISTNDLGNSGSGGSLTDTDEIQIMVNSVNPVVTDVSSTTVNGTYGVDSPIVIAVTFSQNILVNTAGGLPKLLLETGATDREATYSSGSGTETLLFTYTVVAGDASSDLDYQSTSALSLNGATLRNIPGDDVILTLPSPGAAGSLGANKALVIDAVKPSGYSVLIDQDPIITTNQTAVSFTFAGAEVGATFNYSFSSSGGGTNVSGSGTVASATQQVAGIDLTGLAIGTITLNASLTDPSGNIGDEVSHTSQKLAPITATITAQSDVACNGYNTGSLTVEVFGGMADYTYSWSNGTIVAGTSSTTNDLIGLFAGGYSVTVTDGNGQIATASATITEPDALLIAVGGQTDVSCFGGNDGSATVSVSGGTGEYSYSWSPSGGTTATASGLTVGMYTVTVTDANGCSASQSFDISQPTALVASTSQIDAVCGVGGAASVTPSGGTGGYTYLWSTGSTSSIVTDLTAGNHSVLITDMNGCELTKNFTIGGAFILNATTSQSDVSCFGGNDGSATVTVQEGFGPFDYQWTGGGGTGATASGLAAGPYSVTVTDANGCSTVLNVTITQPATASLTTAPVTGVAFSSATLGGTISSGDVGCASETGVVYSTSPNPDLTDSKEVMTVVGGEFSEVISGLALTTTYYAKAYSTNSNGVTVYGNEVSFTTSDVTVLNVTADAGQSKLYGDTDPVLTYTYTGLNPGDDISSVLTGALSREIGEDVGGYIIQQGTLSTIPGSGYSLSYVSADFSITPATLAIIADAGQTKVYGYTEPELTYTYTGFENGDTNAVLSGALSRVAGENVGLYAISQGNLSAGGNYTINFTSADFEISKAILEVTANAGQSKVFGSADPVFAYMATGFTSGDDESILSGALTREAGEDVGAYAIQLGSLSAGGNYTINFTPADFEISKATLEVTANAGQNKVFGSVDPILTYTTTGFENGDTNAVLSGLLTREAGEDVGAYVIQLGSLSAGLNYIINFTGTDFVIVSKGISGITFGDGSFVYDGTVKSLAISGTLPNGTAVVYTNNIRTDVGTQQVTATISGSNYTELVLTADLTITPATITGITLGDGSFVYDGTVKSLAITGTLPTGTSIAYTANSRTDVGTQEVTATITGSNYTQLLLTADLEITPATITGITFGDDSFVYDGTAKSLAITGTLPTGTSVAYTTNSRTDVGT
ncbi:beta strand repeat-containing protein, partial [Sphingobacterium pedocola]